MNFLEDIKHTISTAFLEGPVPPVDPKELISRLLATWEENTPPQGSVLAQDAQLSLVG